MTDIAGKAAHEIVKALDEFIAHSVISNGGDTTPMRPLHRVHFHWPPHPVSYDYHILPSDWTSRTVIEMYGESFDVHVAKTSVGVFGRCEILWNEARGESIEEMLVNLGAGCEPYFRRQFVIGSTLGLAGRFKGQVQELSAIDLVKLLFCLDRDVAHEAHTVIETRASTGLFSLALVEVIKDDSHPARRIAQWCALDMFEDLPAFFPDLAEQQIAVDAIQGLIWNATDDFARTIYKAGVVLGGHICTDAAADALLTCILAPSKFGRRSAIHAAFHLAEWMPLKRIEILVALKNSAETDREPLLREFAWCMARDVEAGAIEHVTEPAFEGE